MARPKTQPTHSVGRIIDKKVLDFILSSNFKNKEHLIIICSLIEDYTVIANNYKNLSISRFVNISDKTIEELITDSDNRIKAKKFLLDNKIIECDFKYVTNDKAYGYRIHDDYNSLPEIYFLEKNTLIKNIIKKRNAKYNSLPEQYHIARNNFMKIKIDYTKANEYTNSLYLNDINKCNDYKEVIKKYKYYFSSILRIQNGDLYFTQNKTNNRIDNNLSNLPTDLRKFIISDKQLYNLDCTNSQPFLFAIVLIENGIVDINYNREAVNGTIYQYYANSYNSLYQTNISRDDAKKIIMKILFSENVMYQNYKSVFRLIFPLAYDFIYKRKKNEHNQLAIELQKLESGLIIDEITNKLNLEKINYYTIHDSIVVDEDNVEKTMKILVNTFIEKYNINPPIKQEKL